MGSSGPPESKISITLDQQMRAAVAHVNIGKELIVITEDKTWRCLVEWKEKLETRGNWIAPLSLLAALTFMFVTSTFHDALTIPKETWQSFALWGMIASAIWFVKTLVRRVRMDMSGSGSVDALIERMKKGATKVDSDISVAQSPENSAGTSRQ